MGQIYEKKGVAGKILGTKELRGRIGLETEILGGGREHFVIPAWDINEAYYIS